MSLWAVLQLNAVRRGNADLRSLRAQLTSALQSVSPLRQAVERRAVFARRTAIADDVRVLLFGHSDNRAR